MQKLTVHKNLPSVVTAATSEKPRLSHITNHILTQSKIHRKSKEETDNVPTDETEQVTSDMKQGLSFQMLSFFKKFKQ